jgi:hypothetical protein
MHSVYRLFKQKCSNTTLSLYNLHEYQTMILTDILNSGHSKIVLQTAFRRILENQGRGSVKKPNKCSPVEDLFILLYFVGLYCTASAQWMSY